MFNYANLGAFFRKMRKERQLSMQLVADIIGISVESLGKFERGASRLKAEHLMELCDLFSFSSGIFDGFYLRNEAMQQAIQALLPDVDERFLSQSLPERIEEHQNGGM